MAECIVASGWNNGLYRIEEQADGALLRIPTGAELGYRKLAERLKQTSKIC